MIKAHLQKAFIPALAICFAIAATPARAAEEAPEEKSTTVHKLDNVVVTASGFEQDIKNAPASITVITREELEKRQFSTLADALRGVEGITQIGDVNSGFSIRGMDTDAVLILIDGKRQNTSGINIKHSPNAGMNNNWIPPVHAIERIEIVRGPMSTLYGSEALGGVINIITRKVGDDWHGSISWDHTYMEDNKAGDLNQYNVYLSGPVVADKVGIQLWGFDKRQQKDYNMGNVAEVKRQSGDVRLWLLPVKEHTFMLEASKEIQDYWGKATNSRVWANDDATYTRDMYTISHDGDWGFGKSQARFYYEESSRDSPTENIHPKTTNKVGDLNFTLPIANHMAVLGGQWKDYKHTQEQGLYISLNGADVNSTLYEWSLFAEDEWAITEKFSMVGGIRYDKNEYFGHHWSPRGYILFHVTPEFTIKGGVAKGFKSPTLAQVDSNISFENQTSYVWGNSDLQPQKSVNYELGAHYANETITGGVTIFYTDYKNKIANSRFTDSAGNYLPDPLGRPKNWATYYNYGEAFVRGVEANFSYKFTPDVKLSANYTYTDSEIKSSSTTVHGQVFPLKKGNPISKTPEHMANVTLDWQIFESLGSFFMAHYEGKETQVSWSSEELKKNDKGLITFDLGLNWKAAEHIDISATVYNLTDAVRSNDDANEIADYEYGRRYWVKFAVNF